MKATGIVRRIDDLGRVVIPKEIRRTLNIREGDPLEVLVGENGSVVFQKYETPAEDKPLSPRSGLKITRFPCVPHLPSSALRTKPPFARLSATIPVELERQQLT